MDNKLLILIRGVPGSGKSTLAAKLKNDAEKQGTVCRIFEADDFFMRNGSYEFDPTKLPEAHRTCLENTKAALMDVETELVIVSNTFVKQWEIEPYLTLGSSLPAVTTKVLRMTTSFGSVHGVPEDKIAKMAASMEPVAGEKYATE